MFLWRQEEGGEAAGDQGVDILFFFCEALRHFTCRYDGVVFGDLFVVPAGRLEVKIKRELAKVREGGDKCVDDPLSVRVYCLRQIIAL